MPTDAVEFCGSGNINVVNHYEAAPNVLFLVNSLEERNLSVET